MLPDARPSTCSGSAVVRQNPITYCTKF